MKIGVPVFILCVGKKYRKAVMVISLLLRMALKADCLGKREAYLIFHTNYG